MMFFSSAKECCDTYFAKVNCQIYDRGCRIDTSLLEGECDGDVWHPDQKGKRGGKYMGCTNAAGYPKSWENDPKYVFGNARYCCNDYQVDGRCAVRDGCTNEVTYLEFTKNPTRRPTNVPTPKVRL